MKKRDILRLHQERERRGWSRNYVAEQVEVDIVTVGRWERGERLPHPQYRQKLCALFGMNAEELGLFSKLDGAARKEIDEMAPPDDLPNNGNEIQSSLAEQPMLLLDEPPVIIAEPAAGSAEKVAKTSLQKFRERRLVLRLSALGLVALVGAGVMLTLDKASSASKPVPRQLLDPGIPNWINRLAWSPDGRSLASATGVNLVSIWDQEQGKLLFHYPTMNSWVNDVSWSRTNWLAAATAAKQSGSIELWNYPESLSTTICSRSYAFRAVSWSPSGAYLAFAGHSTTVEVWDPFLPRQINQYTYPALGSLGINRVRWSAAGILLACATDDGTVHVWEALTGKPQTIYRGHQERAIDLAWSPDSRYIASASADKTVHVWEALTGLTVCIYQGHSDEVEGIDWSLQGHYIVSGGADQTVQVWEALTGKLISDYGKLHATVETVLWSHDGTLVALGTNTLGIELWPFRS